MEEKKQKTPLAVKTDPQKEKSFHTEIIRQMLSLATSGFGLVAALAWNEAIQTIFKTIFGEASSISAMLTYAVVITIVAVIATIWIGRVAERHK